tara:strand:- start:223 stop:381 length:159 start_codon:yes stop_codon:yes gene_type:complete
MTTKIKRNKQLALTFGKGEEHLLDVLDENLKTKLFITRSGWIKNKIREDFLV